MTNTSQSWISVDKKGLQKTMARKSKAFCGYELLQNGFDARATEVRLDLSEPKNGISILRCVDNSPSGYTDLSHAHTMFSESVKKTDHKLRGRFNVGEKMVLAMCDKASITSTTGRVKFLQNGKRVHDKVKTKVGSEFEGTLPLTPAEYADVIKKIALVVPPIPTFINGVLIPTRVVLHEFKATLPTEIADDSGISRTHQRSTIVRLFEPLPGETAMLYELGMPVVEIDCKWHADVQQKVPLNIERDNVNPSYLRALYTAILEEKGDDISDEDAAAAWVTVAMENTKTSSVTLKKVFDKRFGEGAVIQDHGDLGSNKEATAAGRIVVPTGAFSKQARKNLMNAGVKKAGEEFSTASKGLNNIIPDDKLTTEMLRYKKFIQQVSPLVLDHPLKAVRFANDLKANLLGCTQWLPLDYTFSVNVALHDVSDWTANYDLFIHELAHWTVQRNDHLFEGFWRAVSDIGAKLAQVALTHPRLFLKPLKLAA